MDLFGFSKKENWIVGFLRICLVFRLDIGLIDVLVPINFWYKHTTTTILPQLEQYLNFYERLHLVFWDRPRISTWNKVEGEGCRGKGLKNKRGRDE